MLAFPSPVQVRGDGINQKAREWSQDVEASMDAGRYRRTKEAEDTLLCDLLQRYRETVTPQKRGATEEAIRLKALERRRLAKLPCLALPESLAAALLLT